MQEPDTKETLSIITLSNQVGVDCITTIITNNVLRN